MFGGGDGGGLFGDLPTAKNAAKTKTADDGYGGKPEQQQQLRGGESIANDGDDAARKKKKNSAMSLVGALGNAGTATAFMPSALVRKRQLQRGGGAVAKREKAAATTAPTKDATFVAGTTPSAEGIVSDAGGGEGGQAAPRTSQEPKPKPQEEGSATPPMEDETEEPETMRLLHASVTDPYDPLVPNDYLAYRERKKNEQIQREMEKTAREQLERQRKLRERIEEERRKVEATGDLDKIVESRLTHTMAAVSGNGPSGAAAAAEGMGRGRGRGRGRGMSNLPAWLVKKQQEAKSGSIAAAATPPGETVQSGRFDDDHTADRSSYIDIVTDHNRGRVVILANMVGPGEVDDELASEVRDECEEKCGEVEFVRVRDASPAAPEVRVYVVFVRAEHAVEAARAFHGRRFGQRQISARLAEKGEG